MRIKLSKSDWRKVGQKMGWLKKSQATGTGEVSTPALPALPATPATPAPVGQPKGVMKGTGITDNAYTNNTNINLPKALNNELAESHKEVLKKYQWTYDFYSECIDPKKLRSYIYQWDDHAQFFWGLKGNTVNKASPNLAGNPTFEMLESRFKEEDSFLESNYQKARLGTGYKIRQSVTPAQTQRFDKEVTQMRQLIEKTKQLIRKAFTAWMAFQYGGYTT